MNRWRKEREVEDGQPLCILKVKIIGNSINTFLTMFRLHLIYCIHRIHERMGVKRGHSTESLLCLFSQHPIALLCCYHSQNISLWKQSCICLNRKATLCIEAMVKGGKI
jgi:hypothetical protein